MVRSSHWHKRSSVICSSLSFDRCMVIPKARLWQMWELRNGELRRRKELFDLCLTRTVTSSTLFVQTISHISLSITSSKITPRWSAMDGILYMVYVCLSVQYSLHFPYPCRYLRQRWTVVVKEVKARTVTLTVVVWPTPNTLSVVYTVDHVVIVNENE